MRVGFVKRETCLYCEQEGVETRLVFVGRWGVCPVHGEAFLSSLPRAVVQPELIDKPVGTARPL